jgi:hypothetical protein
MNPALCALGPLHSVLKICRKGRNVSCVNLSILESLKSKLKHRCYMSVKSFAKPRYTVANPGMKTTVSTCSAIRARVADVAANSVRWIDGQRLSKHSVPDQPVVVVDQDVLLLPMPSSSSKLRLGSTAMKVECSDREKQQKWFVVHNVQLHDKVK